MAAPEPPFSAEHEALRESVRRFVLAELRPHATEWEEARWFPGLGLHVASPQHGFLGLKYEERYGGQGGDYLHEAVLAEELAHCGSGGVAAGVGAHINIATPPIAKFGTEEQKERYLRPAIAGEKIGALAITEPDAGSDVAGIKSHAERVDGGWVVNGSKMFITNGVRAHFWVTAVKTTGEGGHHGLSFFIIDRQDGVSASKIEKLGWHASDTALMSLRRRLRARGEPARPRERGLLPDHGQLPVGAAGHGARRGRRDAGRLRQDGGLRQGAPRVRQGADRPPGPAPQARRDRHDRPRLARA